jgi:dihydroneopterin triphosphate diphosphatase
MSGAASGNTSLKLPLSVLVVVHTGALEVLLLERARRGSDGRAYWQSVTGSLDRTDEPLEVAAAREVREETGIDAELGRLEPWNVVNTFEIYPQWRHRFPPGVVHNTEHVFGLALPERPAVRISPLEHQRFEWLPWREAAARCFSWSNRDAIVMLGERAVIS